MPSRIVTYVRRPKQAPRTKTVPSAGLAVVTPPHPANDYRRPADGTANVTTASRKQMKLERVSRRQENHAEDPETAATMRAWMEKAKWGRGPAG